MLTAVMSADLLTPMLAQSFMHKLFAKSVFGSYPGIEFWDDPANKLPELDVVLLLRDGRLIVGECKNSASGLREEDLTKLWTVADRLDAAMTFVATLDEADECGDLWWTDAPSTRKHVTLTAEHLYELDPIAVLGDDPLAKRSRYRARGPARDATRGELISEHSKHLKDRRQDFVRTIAIPWREEEP
ncbi:hypothetical protein GCM10023203_39720 [Actinomycetospora straminea]|uniref:Restriction endonuclease n=1 Tax=Actinomycetospora straminea TaxID=663607 RepID=A0ABP9ERL5_9PSEU